MLAGNANHILWIFFLIIIVKSKFFKDYFVIVCMFRSSTEANFYNGTKWSATKRPKYNRKHIGQIRQFEQNLPLSFY